MQPYYSHNGITIYHADWRNVVFPPCDLLLTDPPYGIKEAAGKNKSRGGPVRGKKNGLSYHGRVVQAKDYGNLSWDDAPPSTQDLLALRNLTRHQIIFGGNFFELPPSSCWLVWDKDNSGDFADCELAWTNLEKAVRKFKWRWNGILQEDMSRKEYRAHPTQKPVPVMKWCLSQAPQDVRTVLDPFAGSGSTLIACKAAGLECIGIEREEQYCEAAALRLSQEVFSFEAVKA